VKILTKYLRNFGVLQSPCQIFIKCQIFFKILNILGSVSTSLKILKIGKNSEFGVFLMIVEVIEGEGL